MWKDLEEAIMLIWFTIMWGIAFGFLSWAV